jgi:hypothetical protein
VAKANPRSISLAARPTASRRDYWRTLLEECHRSGLPQGEFCRRRGIPPGTLSCWKHKLAHECEPAARPAASDPIRQAARAAFLPVRITAGRPPSTTAVTGTLTAAGVEIEITLGHDRLVRVRGRVDPQWLRQAILTLGRLGC